MIGLVPRWVMEHPKVGWLNHMLLATSI